MEPYWIRDFANPSAIHAGGMHARRAIKGARKSVAGILQCTPQEVVFVPGGTAGNNLAILGVARALRQRTLLSNSRPLRPSVSEASELDNNKNSNLPRREKRALNHFGHIIVSAIEHESVLEPAKQLEKEGFAVTYAKPEKNGIVQPETVKKALRPDTILVSIMYANNEIGTIQPIREIAKVIRGHRKAISSKREAIGYPLLHTDACQAANYLDLNVWRLGVDLMTLNGSKIYGPKMSGALYIRKGIKPYPVLYGGGQEEGLWSGTENVPGIAGFAKALEIAQSSKDQESRRLSALRDYVINKLRKDIRSITLNGDAIRRLPNNIHISAQELEGEVLVAYLDARGVAASVGSACTSQSSGPSHVLSAIGLSPKLARGSIRLTLGRNTVKTGCDYAATHLKEIVKLLHRA